MGASLTFVTFWYPRIGVQEKKQALHGPALEDCSSWHCDAESGRYDYPELAICLWILTFQIALYLIWARRP